MADTATAAQIAAWRAATPITQSPGYGTGWDPDDLRQAENDAALAMARQQSATTTAASSADKTRDPNGWVQAQLAKYVTDNYGNQKSTGAYDGRVMNDLVSRLGPDRALQAYQGWADQNHGNLYAASAGSHGTGDVAFAQQALHDAGDPNWQTYAGSGAAGATPQAPPVSVAQSQAPPVPPPSQQSAPGPAAASTGTGSQTATQSGGSAPARSGGGSFGGSPAPSPSPRPGDLGPEPQDSTGTAAGNSGSPSGTPTGSTSPPPTSQPPAQSGQSSFGGGNAGVPGSPGTTGSSGAGSFGGQPAAPPTGSAPGGNPAAASSTYRAPGAPANPTAANSAFTVPGQSPGGGWAGAGGYGNQGSPDYTGDIRPLSQIPQAQGNWGQVAQMGGITPATKAGTDASGSPTPSTGPSVAPTNNSTAPTPALSTPDTFAAPTPGATVQPNSITAS